MPLDPSIALQTKVPEFAQPDISAALTAAAKIKTAQLETHKAENDVMLGYLAQAKDQASYDQGMHAALSDPLLSESTKKRIAQAPQVYDPNFVNSTIMASLDVKDRLALAAKQQENEFGKTKFEETKRHNMAMEGNQNVPSGYQPTGSGALSFIPGGPADPTVRQAVNPQQRVQIEKTLRDDFQQQSKDYQTVADFYQRAQQGYQAAQQGNPQGDQTLLFSFMKVLDPTSVVRESEYATAGSFRGVPEAIWQQFEKARSGQALTPQQRDNIMQQMNGMFSQKGGQQLNNEQNYAAMAERNNADPQSVMIGVPSVAQISPTFPGLNSPVNRLQPPPMKKTKDTTPSTPQSQLLPSPWDDVRERRLQELEAKAKGR